jgi:hypothetical protein
MEYPYLSPILREAKLTRYDRGSLYYIVWNQMIEKYNVFKHRIEDGLDSRLANFFGFDELEYPTSQPKNVFSLRDGKERFFSAEQISNGEVRKNFVEIGERYGYSMGKGTRFL